MEQVLRNNSSLFRKVFGAVFMTLLIISIKAQDMEISNKYMDLMLLDCGNFRTQTQGGWGANAAGNNPGVYRDLHFEDAFPNGLSIGCDYTLTLTTSQAVQDFLPSGSTASVLDQNLIDPQNYNNVLAGQLIALSLSIGFDENDADFSGSDVNLGNLIIHSGTFQGWTVYELVEEANQFIGGCAGDYSASELNESLTAINENFDNGNTDNGYLDCPDDVVTDLLCTLSLENVTTYCNDELSYSVEISISGHNATYIVEDANALSGSGEYICFGDSEDLNTITSHTFILTYSSSANYSASVYALVPSLDACAEPINSEECIINDISGTAPICCDFSITCPTNNQLVYSCIQDIPAADTSLIIFENNCGPVSIDVIETSNGQGCTSNPLYFNRTYVISDGSTTLNCVYNYIVIDGMPPIITCPEPESAECSSEMVPVNWATATDNCDSDVEISYVNVFTGSCTSFTRVWSAVDDCGNTATCNQLVNISDNTPPILVLPADITLNCGTGSTPAITGNASATDVCSEVTLSYEDGEITGDNCTSSFIRTWTATDACSNTVSGEQIISFEDNVGPIIFGIPSTSFMQCGEIPDAPQVVAFDVCQNDSVEVVLTETIYGDGCQKAIFRTWTAIDSCGNTSSATRAIYINDTQGPVISCPENVVLNCGDAVPDPSDAGMATAIDNCSGENVTINYVDGPLSNECPPSIHRIWTATDTCGNISNCVQLISFIDNEAPTMECVNDITINCAFGDISPVFTGTPTVSDDCSSVQLIYSDGSYSGDCPVSFTRTWTAVDACQNMTSCEQIITMIDETGPAIYCPPAKTVSCGASLLPSNTGMAGAYDNCTSVTLTYEDGDLSGSCPQSFIRTWIATDYCGNISTCEQTINISDNTPPVIECPETIDLDCNASDYSIEVTGSPVATDQCSDVTLSHIDSPIQGSCPQYFYRIWTAIDECQNTSQCYQLINLVDNTAPEIICPEDLVISCNEDSNPQSTGYASANDDCSSIEITYADSLVLNETSGGSGDCGQFRTQTQGGWGSVANGNNPGAYRDHYFDLAFPNGLSIGCDYTLTLTSSLAVQNFLPAGGTPWTLMMDMVNPVGYGNTLAGQITALGLSLGFDNYDPNFSQATGSLADLIVASGMFAGWTVGDIYMEANNFIGQCQSNYSAAELNNVLSNINENFVDGRIDNGYLLCDDDVTNCLTIYRTWTAVDECGNTSNCTQIISAENPTIPISMNDNYYSALSAYPSPTLGEVNITSNKEMISGDLIEVFDISGTAVLSYRISDSGQQVIDLSEFNDGIYLVKWTSASGTSSIKVVKN